MSVKKSHAHSLPVRILASVFCEDVRTEVNGKDMLIGTFAGALVMPHFPSQTLLGVWIAIESEGSGPLTLEFRIRNIKDNYHHGMVVELNEAPKGIRAALAMRGRLFPLHTETTLVLEARRYDQDTWHTLNDLIVAQGEVPQSPHDDNPRPSESIPEAAPAA